MAQIVFCQKMVGCKGNLEQALCVKTVGFLFLEWKNKEVEWEKTLSGQDQMPWDLNLIVDEMVIG
jgi:hypothetical protein